MKISLQWINEILRAELSAEEVMQTLGTIGFAIEGIEHKASDIQGVVVGKVLKVQPHPKADRLTVCSVFDGTIENSIVCGAPNVTEGIIVPLAVEGAVLPGGRRITKAKIRDIDSHGMICSEKELGIGEDAAGIILLPDTTPLGGDFYKTMGYDDTMIECEVTPNRPDALSHIGLAREIATARKISFLPPKVKTRFLSLSECSVSISDPEACNRYIAEVIEGVKVGPAPQYIQRRLALCGVRPINNIVDVTNYVMLETGQPLHAFDYEKLDGQEIRVRFSEKQEKIKALDGKEYSLFSDILVIADTKKPVAIAGIMGGEETAVTGTTTTMLLESAYFSSAVVRHGSKKMGLASESSYRFERGVDVIGCEYASLRAVDLILMCAGGEKTKSKQTYPKPFVPITIELRPERVNALLGVAVTKNIIADILTKLGIEFINKGTDQSLRLQIPSHRVDIKQEIDLIEEIARHIGYHTIPVASVNSIVMSEPLPQTWTFQKEIRSVLNSMGMCEAYNYGFISLELLNKLQLQSDNPLMQYVSITNPISREYTIMRTTLIPGLINNVKTNISKSNPYCFLYECGSVFFKKEEKLCEEKRIAGILSGAFPKNIWESKAQVLDYTLMTGVIETLLKRLRIKGWYFESSQASYLQPGQSADIMIDDRKAGEMGTVHADVCDEFGIDVPVFVFEILVASLIEAQRIPQLHVPIPRFPSIIRDFSFIFKKGTTWCSVKQEIQHVGGELIEAVVPFDRYEGKQIKEHTYSLSFSVTLRAADRTLTDAEADAIQNNIIQALQRTFSAELRT